MYLVDDHNEPYVTLFSVQYTLGFVDQPSRPHDTAFKLKRDPKGREGVFVQSFSYGGIVPHMAASSLWPMCHMRWRPPLHSDGRNCRVTVIL